MDSFIIILLITILSVMYVCRLVKYKFRDEKRPIWKLLHIAAFVIVFIPFLSVGLVMLIDNVYLIEKGILVVGIVLLYLGYKKYTK